MNEEQQRPDISPGAPTDDPGAGISSDSAGTGGMANTMPPALPGSAAPGTPPPPAPPQTGTRMGFPAGMGGVRGVMPPGGTIAEGAAATAGQDIRHRGWYWHWNTLITQYAPLLGLKGVGLLNSYTVWTDRREGSPHQGYAFPTQDAEGKFYGEGREELITLNKVLVALDLIEIHKEMVLRQDDRNRRWRVPHNFYRVKDPRDGLVLNLPAVIRVLELANRDRNVFRGIRHIFGAQFAPIDRTSIWHYLLPELRQLPLWQQLAERAERERRGGKKILTLVPPEEAATNDLPDQTIARDNDIAPHTIERSREEGIILTDKGHTESADFAARTDGVLRMDAESADVAPSDAEGYSTTDEGKTFIEPARPSFVAPTDRTYDQPGESEEETRTRTSTRSTNTRESVSSIFEALAERDERDRTGPITPDAASRPAHERRDPRQFLPEQPLPPVPDLPEDGAVIVRALDVTEPTTSDDLAHQTATITDIEAALTMTNGRPPSDMEMSLLVQVARECDPAARAQGYGPGTGLGWVLAAIWNAVNSGSTRMGFIAPKLVAAICDRWVIEGFGSDNRANPTAPPSMYPTPPTWPMPSMSGEPAAHPSPDTMTDSALLPVPPEIGSASAPPATTADTAATEAEARRLWEQVMRRLEGVLHPDALERWFIGARVTAIEHDRVIVVVPGADIALKLASYRGLISRRMSEALGRTVDVVFQATRLSTPLSPSESTVQQSTQVYSPPVSETSSPWSWPTPTASGSFPSVSTDVTPAPSVNQPDETPRASRREPPAVSAASIPLSATGLTNRQIWAMALQDLQGRMSGATFAVWIRPAELVAIEPDGTLVIGARNRVQRERLERQHLADLTIVLGKILDRPVGVRVVMIGEADGRGVGEQRGA
ncbi:MAG: DnaA N-terminal domain-containing protein [Thermomicrobiales bacterium]